MGEKEGKESFLDLMHKVGNNQKVFSKIEQVFSKNYRIDYFIVQEE